MKTYLSRGNKGNCQAVRMKNDADVVGKEMNSIYERLGCAPRRASLTYFEPPMADELAQGVIILDVTSLQVSLLGLD